MTNPLRKYVVNIITQLIRACLTGPCRHHAHYNHHKKATTSNVNSRLVHKNLEKGHQNAVQNAYFKSLEHSSQKLWPKPDKGNFAPCILPCKIGGSQNLMKERYLSKTPNVTFVYLSTCNTKLPGFFGNSKKCFYELV